MTNNPSGKVSREARLRWIPLGKMRVSPLAQRELNQARVDHIAVNMDLEQLGTPTVNERDGWFYIIDGQHRIEGYKQWNGEGWESQQLQCWTYFGLSEEEEAERFLKLNDVLQVNAMAKFRVGVQAGRVVETEIDRIVRAQGLSVTADRIDGGVRAVGTLRRVYERDGAAVLGRTLRIIRDSYGNAGFEAAVVDGLGMLCGRYNGQLDDVKTVTQLSRAAGGVKGLLNSAELLRRSTGNAKGHCVAAAAVQIINRARGPKLPSWWKSEPAE